MATFGLVHGAWLGAWCWERLEPELAKRGHRAVTVDLPREDPDATFATYADVVVSAFEEEGEDLVLVGHSLAGLTVPIAAARMPVRRLVFLCALIADPGHSFVEQQEREAEMLLPALPGRLGGTGRGRQTRMAGLDLAREILFGD